MRVLRPIDQWLGGTPALFLALCLGVPLSSQFALMVLTVMFLCVLARCTDVRLDAMNLLLPEEEREGEGELEQPVSVKQEWVQSVGEAQLPVSESAEAMAHDEREAGQDVLVSLSQPSSAPGGPVRSRILALDKLIELEAGEEAEEEEKEERESEWQSNWQSSDADECQSAPASAQPPASAIQRRQKAQLEHRHAVGGEEEPMEDGEPQVDDTANRTTDAYSQHSHTPLIRKVNTQRASGSSSSSKKRSDGVGAGGKKRKKSK